MALWSTAATERGRAVKRLAATGPSTTARVPTAGMRSAATPPAPTPGMPATSGVPTAKVAAAAPSRIHPIRRYEK